MLYKKKLDTFFDTHGIKIGVQLWRSSRDSNPGGTFMPYEISSHASSTSLSTAPNDWLIISATGAKIKLIGKILVKFGVDG